MQKETLSDFIRQRKIELIRENPTKSIVYEFKSPIIRERFSKKESYIDEVSVGLNYTSDSNIVTTLEYIHNSGGLDSGDWEDWFALGRQTPVLARTLGALRGKSSKEESIMSQDSLFVFSRASDIQTNLDASFLAWVNPYDGSTLSQVGLEYAYDDSVQTNFYLRNYQGDKESEYGSFPNNYEILIEGEYFF